MALATGGELVAQGIEEQFTDIKNRLGETVCAFEVFRVLNEMCDKDVDPELNKKIQKHGMFWQAVLVGQHTVYIMGIGALLDARSDVASLYSVLKLLRKKIPAEVFRDINERLTRIGGRYLIYRHKIFGHNDLYRRDVIAQFNA